MNDKNIKEKLKKLRSSKEKLEYLEEKIKRKREKFEKKIELERIDFEKTLTLLKEDINDTHNKFDTLAKDTVTIALGDLVEELAYLADIDLKNISIIIRTNVGYWGNISMSKMHRLMEGDFLDLSCTINNGHNNTWSLYLYGNDKTLTGKKKQIFCYSMNFPLDLNEIQADGKKLLEHASVDVKYNESCGKERSLLSIDKKIEYLNCDIELDNLVRSDYKENMFNSWYPADLFTQAVVNCIDKNKYSNKKKKKLSLV